MLKKILVTLDGAGAKKADNLPRVRLQTDVNDPPMRAVALRQVLALDGRGRARHRGARMICQPGLRSSPLPALEPVRPASTRPEPRLPC